jgi:hypothetical protein
MRLWLGAFIAVAIASTTTRADTFDITTYTPPAGWSANPGKGAIVFTTTDATANTASRPR